MHIHTLNNSKTTTRTDMGYGGNQSSQYATPLDTAVRHGKLAIDFQRLTLSSGEDGKTEPYTSKATGIVGPVKIGATDTIEDVKALQAEADDYGLRAAAGQLGGPEKALTAAARGPAEQALKSSTSRVVISRQPSDRCTSERQASEQDLLETGYLSPAPKVS